MGRGGAGSGGGHSSGGHSSPSRSSSGHRPSSSSSRGSGSRGGISSSRPSGGSSRPSGFGSPPPGFGSGGSMGGGFGGGRPPSHRPPPPPPHRPPPPRYNRSYHRTTYYSGGSTTSTVSTMRAIFSLITIVFVLLFLVTMIRSCSAMSGGNYSVTKHQGLGKTKMTPLAAFQTDCVVDEDNWFADPYQVGKDLKKFYDSTGIQPYVLIKSPDSSLTSDSAKESFADAWYSENIEHEGALLYVYFAETDPDIVGYSTLTGGSATKAFFDSVAMDTFWDIYDSYYFNSSITEEQLIVNTFNDTATICLSDKTITNTQSSGLAAVFSKAVPLLIIAVIVIVIGIVVTNLVKTKHKRAAEAAAETERILNTPIEQLGDNSDDLLNKYNNGQ